MSTYDELFSSGIDLTADDADAQVLRSILQALCAQTDATREQTAEFRNLRITLTNQAQASGSVMYPWCSTCNCHHHQEDDNCFLRGGRGAIDITTAPRAPESQANDIAAMMAGMSEDLTGMPEGLAGPSITDQEPQS